MPTFPTKCDECKLWGHAWVHGFRSSKRSKCPRCGSQTKSCQYRTVHRLEEEAGYQHIEWSSVPAARASRATLQEWDAELVASRMIDGRLQQVWKVEIHWPDRVSLIQHRYYFDPDASDPQSRLHRMYYLPEWAQADEPGEADEQKRDEVRQAAIRSALVRREAGTFSAEEEDDQARTADRMALGPEDGYLG